MAHATTLQTAQKLLARYGDAAWLLIDAVNPSAAVAGPAIYICDVESGRTVVLETAQGALQTLSEQIDLDEVACQTLPDALALLLDDLLSGNAGNQSGIHPDTRRGVILGAAFLITGTRGFHITKHHGADVQHLLLRYPDAEAGGHVLTPMPLFKRHPLAVPDLDASVTHVLLSEQLNFPARFADGKPLRFKELRRNVLSGKS